MNQIVLTVFVGLTAIAVILQTAVLIALYVSSKKTGARLEVISREMEENVLPMVRQARALFEESAPKVHAAVDNLSAISTTLRQQSERLSATANNAVDRVRLQIVRADEMTTRALDRVEETTETIQHAVSTPVKQFSAVLTGVVAGLADFTAHRKVQRQKNAVPRDEMFI